ncbi:MAG: hypothetical protein OEU36_16100 [Gammaproteobacteria bacterium]|nr:hypothetical protein [Gammaproteobacteria bacterium]
MRLAILFVGMVAITLPVYSAKDYPVAQQNHSCEATCQADGKGKPVKGREELAQLCYIEEDGRRQKGNTQEQWDYCLVKASGELRRFNDYSCACGAKE